MFKGFVKLFFVIVFLFFSYVYAGEMRTDKSIYNYLYLGLGQVFYDTDSFKIFKAQNGYSIDVIYEVTMMGSADDETMSICPLDGNYIEYVIYNIRYSPKKIFNKLVVEYKGFVSGDSYLDDSGAFHFTDQRFYYGKDTKKFINYYDALEEEFIFALGKNQGFDVLEKDIYEICKMKKLCE